jgi:hypothetical protein
MNVGLNNRSPTWPQTVRPAGCATIKARLPAPVPPPATGAFQAGATRVDITPVPGFPMGGHSVGGQIARGVWNPLAARAIFLEDPQGHSLMLVACDLWSLPAGLADRVAELVAADPAGSHIGRNQIVLAATHTHQSPGNFSSCALYNEFGSVKSGFGLELFNFLASRLAGVIIEAARTKEPARVFFGETTVANLARNRSFPAFARDPECDAILNANAALPLGPRLPDYPDLDACRADGPIAQRFTHRAPLAHVCVTNLDGTSALTAGYPLGGAPQLGGAEDGRTEYFFRGYVEGMVGDGHGEHGAKLAAVDLRYLGFHLPVPITRLDFMTMIVGVDHTAARWRAVWLPPPGRVEPAGTYRFEVRTPGGRTLGSEPFHLPP